MTTRRSALGLVALLVSPAAGLMACRSTAFAADVDAPLKRTLEDYTPPAKMDNRTLHARIRTLHEALKSGNVKGDARRLARRMVKLYRAELRSRRPEDGQQPQPPAGAAMPDGSQDLPDEDQNLPDEGN
jgi:hypothetical protein